MSVDFVNSWLRDDLETLRRDVEIAMVIYDIRLDLLPTAIENVIEKSQHLVAYVLKDDIQVSYAKPVENYSDRFGEE